MARRDRTLDGITQNHNLAFSGGNDNGNYRASLGFIQKQGAIRNSDMRNYTAKLDAQQLAFNKKLKLEMGVMGSEYEGKQQYDMQKIFYSAASYNPTYPNTKNATTGKWDEDMLANEIYNPLGQLEIDNRYSVGVVMAHGKATWTIVDGLFLSAFGSYTKANIDLKRYIPNDIRQGELNGNGWAYINSIQRNDLMGNVQLTFTKDFGKHHIDALAVMEGQRYKTFTHMQQAKGFQTNYFKYNNLPGGCQRVVGRCYLRLQGVHPQLIHGARQLYVRRPLHRHRQPPCRRFLKARFRSQVGLVPVSLGRLGHLQGKLHEAT